ncbi:MAG: hypothetical protein IKS83_01390, partial [Victivallales bacterium]|nr:hypothetical protein [Victivallales bacterium]
HRDLERLYSAFALDFDRRELLPKLAIHKAMTAGDQELLVFYDEQSNITVGYALVMTRGVYGYVLLKYFGILQWFREKPLAFLELTFRKLLLFWDAGEIPNNISMDVQGKESALLQAPFLLPWGILGTLGLAGMLCCIRRGRLKYLALLWMMFAFWCATSAFYILARFRIGFLPLLCCAGAGAVTLLGRRLRRPSTSKRPSRFLIPCFVLFLALYMVHFAYPIYQNYAEAAIQRRINPNGINLEFPHSFVLYDHGPFSPGNSSFEVPSQGLLLTKRFRLPEEFRAHFSAKDVDCIVRQRLLLRVFGPPRGLPSAVLTYNGTRLPVSPSMRNRQGVKWLCFDFEAPLPPEDGQAIFSIDLGPSPEYLHFFIAFDNLRNYGRTSLRVVGIEEEVMPAEAVVEWEIPRWPPPFNLDNPEPGLPLPPN